ncbi:hypothetical protein [Saccharicrinis fermentans]|uniref:hypothetical protein n=1 Tax=Saccharicrinis fermentans TaxID=982 RepID=UPI000482C8FA|nr:hypothetical protein [Saccharicrinis fermentans]
MDLLPDNLMGSVRTGQIEHKPSNVKHCQFWRHDNKPIELWSNKVIDEKINYIHINPVEEGLVFQPEDYGSVTKVGYKSETVNSTLSII